MIDLRVGVQWRRRQAQPFGSTRYGRVVDGLNIDAMMLEQAIGHSLAMHGITNVHGHDVTFARKYRQACVGQPALQRARAFLMFRALDRTRLEMADARDRTGGDGWRERR